MLERLRAAAKVEGYDEDSLTVQFDILEKMLRRPLERDLDKHRDAIETADCPRK